MKNAQILFLIYILLQLCGVLLLMTLYPEPLIALPFLLSLLALGPIYLSKKSSSLLTICLFGLIALFWWPLWFFLLALFWLFYQEHSLPNLWGVAVLFPLLSWPQLHFFSPLLVLWSGLLWFFARQTNQLQQLESAFLQLKDDSYDRHQHMQNQNQQLLEQRAALLELEISQERNRIARDIHDNVGHLLSSSILQLAAIRAINQQTHLTQPLQQLETTIHQGMDNIRQSVHDLHQDSLSLSEALQLLLTDFPYQAVTITGVPFHQLSKKSNQVLLLVTKEALVNVVKHSNAQTVTLEFTELPAFYRYQIKDDGTAVAGESHENGLGLISMRQRVEAIGGQFHSGATEAGFQITVTLPKVATS